MPNTRTARIRAARAARASTALTKNDLRLIQQDFAEAGAARIAATGYAPNYTPGTIIEVAARRYVVGTRGEWRRE